MDVLPLSRQVDLKAGEGHLQLAARSAHVVHNLKAMAGTPLVSVMVTAYNSCQYALDLLDALSRQRMVPFELVLVDDGSTDGTFGAVVERGDELGLAGRVIRLQQNHGRATARNLGILHASADIIAFTDSDCLPAPGWLAAGVERLAEAQADVVQGVTRPHPSQPRPFFNHFIEIEHFDGTFSTCNVFYRREILLEVDGFDSRVVYWEDLDLGWRICRAGGTAVFSAEAVTYHQVIPLSPSHWLRWPIHFGYLPAKVSRYPEYRAFLFLGLWVHWHHALFDLAILAAILGTLIHPAFLLLVVPYAVAFPFQRGLAGRWPPLKALLHVAWDAVSFGVLAVSSVRHRALVL